MALDHDDADLCLLVRRRDVAAVQALLREAPQLVHRVRWSGVGPLHRAVEGGDIGMAKLLLTHGADANARAAWGWYTPLHLACKRGDEALIWLLLEHGAAWNVVDKERKTPLQWAIRVGKASVAYRVDQVMHVPYALSVGEDRENSSGGDHV
ncbi:hypothetical protein P43SY_001129 [Pythium insidiosum]|uniref:Uncharacterized protein n=1 Tax=Pythium insidiosum TaxID=114742 RepID=A0AAD5LNI9_PYTIN|nr:hypothetical protein P43SY_001129 [Pythium insidiosum]